MLSIPIMTGLCTAETRLDYLRWLRAIGAGRVFLALGMPYDDPDLNAAAFSSLAENIAFFRAHAATDADGQPAPEPPLEVGIWIMGLGHGMGMPPAYRHLTERYTKLCDLETGAEIADSLCPLDEDYSRMYIDFLTRIASLHPDLIMIDDDYRLAGHGPVAIACACDRHMALFNARARAAGVSDRDHTRAELAAFLFNGPATPHRRIWLELMHDTLCDHAKKLRRAVDAVDPAIRLGHCACLPTWDLDGADSIELAHDFAGQNRPFLRLIGAPYWGENKGVIVNLERMQAAWCRAQAPEMEIFSEGDVSPRPRFNMPAAYLEVFHQMLLCDGLPDILKYMLDYEYEPGYETGYMRLHQSKAPLRAAMAEAFADTEPAGIYVLEVMHKLADMDCTGMHGYDLFEAFKPASARYAARLGLPVAYEHTRYTPTTLIFGENAKYADDTLLADHLILDATAARILLERGVDIGITAIEPMPRPATETLGTPARTYPVDTDGRFFRLTPQASAVPLSTYDTGAPALLRYIRPNGRTVLIYAFAMYGLDYESVYMKNDCRRRQVLDERALGIPVDVPEGGLYVLCRRNAQRTVVGLWNIGADIALSQEAIRLDRPHTAIRPIGPCPDGGTVSVCGDTVSLTSEIPPCCFGGFVAEV